MAGAQQRACSRVVSIQPESCPCALLGALRTNNMPHRYEHIQACVKLDAFRVVTRVRSVRSHLQLLPARWASVKGAGQPRAATESTANKRDLSLCYTR